LSVKLNKLQALTAFTHVAEEGGFAAAAARSNMSPSAVTKAIARLEDELGTRLINRTTRSVALTEYGRDFYQRCVRILADLDEAEARLRETSNAPQGRVRVAMPFAFGRAILLPKLGDFYQRHPSIVLDVEFSDGAVDLIKGGFDLAVRFGDLPDSGLIRRVLLTTRAVTVASPRYLQSWGEPSCPNELLDHSCIIDSRHGSEWRYRIDDQVHPIRINGRAYLNGDDALRDAVRAGTGIVHSNWWLLNRDIEERSVVPILCDFETGEDIPISLLYSAKRHLPAKVVTFIDYLVRITSTAQSFHSLNWFWNARHHRSRLSL
jgi:DNA-binding transcriptional LysR family regulator